MKQKDNPHSKIGLMRIILVMIACLGLSTDALATGKIEVTDVILSSTTLTLSAGGSTETLTATVIPSNATIQRVSWRTSNRRVATVSKGVVTPRSPGTAIITVKTRSGKKKDRCVVTVLAAAVSVTGISMEIKELELKVGGEPEPNWANVYPFNATDPSITWSSNNPDVATVDINGMITPVNEGHAVITAETTDGGYKDTCSITVVDATVVSVTGVSVSPTSLSLTAGGATGTLSATVSPSNATDNSVTWSSGDTSVATVSNGVVTPVGAGSATITVETNDGNFTDTCTVTVAAASVPVTGVSVSPTTLTLTVGTTDILSATVTPADATDPSVTWSSDDTAVATVDTNGVVTPVAAGSADITVTTTDVGITATCAVTVNAAPAGPITIIESGKFIQYKVSAEEFELWKGQSADYKTTTNEIYEIFYDKFDFIIYMLNVSNPDRSFNGFFFHTKNTVAGLGTGLRLDYDKDAEYGSAGQLQGIVTLGAKNSISLGYSFLRTGPIVHEIGHRWFNFSSTNPGNPYYSHWPNYTLNTGITANDGIFASVTNNYAPVELYLIGLIPYSDIPEGINKTYADAFITESDARIPDSDNSQKDFRGLVVFVTPTDLTDDDISLTDDGVDKLTSIPNTSGVNFYRQTGGRATLKLDGLLDADTLK